LHSIVSTKPFNLYEITNQSKDEVKLGQISGLASSIENPDQLFIFHRGSRQWNQQ
jgi:hypothetical protein